MSNTPDQIAANFVANWILRIYKIGAVMAMIISWSLNHSIGWSIIHGITSWFYIGYYFITR